MTPEQKLRKVDEQLASGEYFMKEEEKQQSKQRAKLLKQQEKAAARKKERALACARRARRGVEVLAWRLLMRGFLSSCSLLFILCGRHMHCDA